MTVKDEIREQLEQGLEELKTMRDEIRVKLHLASMDAKTQWEQLEPKVDEVERQVREAGEEAANSAREGLEKLKASVRSLRDTIV